MMLRRSGPISYEISRIQLSATLPRNDYTGNSHKGSNNSRITSLSSAEEAEIIRNPIDCTGWKLPKKWRNYCEVVSPQEIYTTLRRIPRDLKRLG